MLHLTKLTIRSLQNNLVVGADQLMTALARLPEVKGHKASKVEPILALCCEPAVIDAEKRKEE